MILENTKASVLDTLINLDCQFKGKEAYRTTKFQNRTKMGIHCASCENTYNIVC